MSSNKEFLISKNNNKNDIYSSLKEKIISISDNSSKFISTKENSIKSSIVIPVYNAEKTIEELIKALFAQNSIFDFEVILIDDNSKDKTAQIIRNIINKEKPRFIITFIKIEHSGPAIARNIGAIHAKGDIIIFTDSDCVPEMNWYEAMTEPFLNPNVGGVGGTYKTRNPESLISRYFGYDIEFRHSKYKENIDFIATYSAAYRKELFLKTGMFSDEYTEANAEDNDLSYRIIDSGALIKFASKGVVAHKHPDSIKKLYLQQKNRAVWRVKLFLRNRKHKSDDYTGIWTIIQPFIWMFLSLYLIAFITTKILIKTPPNFISLLFDPILLWILLFSYPLIFFIINFPLIKWIKMIKQENLLNVFMIYLFMLIRSFAWFIGGIQGFYRFIIKKE